MKTLILSALLKASKRLAGVMLFASLVVPAALPQAYAAEGAESSSTAGLRVGDSHGGGKVAYIYRSGDRGYVAGQAHGLIAAKEDLGYGYTWNKAIKVCRDYRGAGFSDWRLPTKEELTKLYVSRFSIGGFKERHYYWSSTESDNNDAWDQSFRSGEHNLGYKLDNNYVRPVRTF